MRRYAADILQYLRMPVYIYRSIYIQRMAICDMMNEPSGCASYFRSRILPTFRSSVLHSAQRLHDLSHRRIAGLDIYLPSCARLYLQQRRLFSELSSRKHIGKYNGLGYMKCMYGVRGIEKLFPVKLFEFGFCYTTSIWLFSKLPRVFFLIRLRWVKAIEYSAACSEKFNPINKTPREQGKCAALSLSRVFNHSVSSIWPVTILTGAVEYD